MKEDENRRDERIACGQVVGVRASMSCGLHSEVKNTCSPRYLLRATLVTVKGWPQGGQIRMDAIRVL